MKRHRTDACTSTGFTLLEIMVVLVILVLLAGLALPGYRDAIRTCRRSDAHTTLSRVALLAERYYLHTNRNAGEFAELDTSFAAGDTVHSDAGYYALVLRVTDDGVGWTLEASPIGDQLADQACARLTLDNLGTRAAFNGAGGSNPRCW